MATPFPTLDAIVEPLIGAPYSQWNCWQLVRHLYREACGENLDEQPAYAWRHVEEIWWQGDPDDPLTLSQQGDLWIMRAAGMASHHVGIVLDNLRFIHTRKRIGVCTELMARWQPRLLQIARLQRLL